MSEFIIWLKDRYLNKFMYFFFENCVIIKLNCNILDYFGKS